MNLIEVVKSTLGREVINKLAAMLGISPEMASKGLDAALPLLLAAFGKAASSPGGAQKLDAAVNRADDNLIGNVLGGLTGGNGKSLAESGGSALSSLLGGDVMGSIANLIGRSTGMGGDSSSQLLAMAAPLLLGTLKSKKNELGLDAGGLVSLLASQKQNIAKAMPAGVSKLLDSAPDLAGISDWAGDSARAAVHKAADVSSRAADAGNTAMNWIWPLAGVALAAIIGFALWRGSKPAAPPVAKAPPVANQAAPAASSVPVTVNRPVLPDVAGLTTGVADLTRSATGVLSGITDGASAEKALPALRQLVGSIDALGNSASGVPNEARDKIVALFQKANGPLLENAQRILALPDLGPGTQAEVMRLRDRLLAMGGDTTTLAKQASDLMTGATRTVSGITDTASAEAAMPKLKQLSSTLDSLRGAINLLPAGLRDTVLGAIRTHSDKLLALIDAALQTPGVGDVIRGTATPLRDSLTALTKA